MKRKTTPLALLLSRGEVAKEYTASMDTLSTLLCFASRGFCSRICGCRGGSCRSAPGVGTHSEP